MKVNKKTSRMDTDTFKFYQWLVKESHVGF